MKRTEWIMILLLVASSFSAELVAQENLNVLAKKCETEKFDGNVWSEIIYTKNDRTKKFEPTITMISVEFNPTLINEFLEALKKDEDKALQKVERKSSGRTIAFDYSFENADYSFYYGEKGECTGIKIRIPVPKSDSK